MRQREVPIAAAAAAAAAAARVTSLPMSGEYAVPVSATSS